MGKITWVTSMILTASLIGLAGCSEKTTREKELEKKIVELQKQIELEKKEALDKDKEKPLEEKNEEEVILVEVVDPNTKQVIKTINPLELGFGTDNENYKKEIEGWVKTIARGTETINGYDQRMIPDKLDENGQVIKGSPRIILEESELVEKVINASLKGGTVELPLYVTESGYKPEEVSNLGEVAIASFTTYFNSSVAGRTKNIELSAHAINNVIVGVGDIFSFNTTVGPSDEAHGYQKAMEAVNGKLVEGIGGGICQTSSTLFNAVDKLGVAYVEKHHHSVNVGYVPKGRDATVSYGGLDFRFQNTTGAPFLLKAVINKGALTIEVRTSKANQSLIVNR
ncbi:VanW family protein [Bacillus sp. CGMCC 1.16607]|uniref:VanW family protein n=1 Tax=Bacillus sp. CGMCC 1.16607 TaxID=3351842 RepID=UPI003642144B